MKFRGLWLGVLLLAATVSRAQTDVLVSHYDAARTGQNLNEPTLTVPNLSATTFGKVYAFALDGYTYTQPLYKSNLTLPGLGTFNVVFAATEHGSVYALDADSATPLWQRSFINPAAGLTTRTTNPALEDIVPEVSITSTPVIDAASGTLYVVAETVQSGSPALFWLHALDITTGADKVPPVSLQASAGSGAGFHVDAPTSEQRPGLFLVNGVVYVGLGSSGDSFPWVGWLLGYNATTLAQVSVFCTSGAGAQGAGVWGSGEAPAVDASGNIFFSTGNGYFSSGSNAWADTFLKLKTAGGLSVLDYFAPFNVAALGLADLDVAAAGIVLLPDAAGSAAHPHLLVGSGKDGEIYLIDRDNMGHFNGSYNTPNSNVVQWIPGQIGTVPVDPTAMPMPYAGNSFTTPAYWQNHVYFCGAKDVCKAFTLANGLLSTTPTSQAPGSFGYPGSQPVISAASSSATSAVLWTIERDSVNNASTLHAYDATNLANEVYNSNQASGSRDRGGPPIKFAVPTVANGKVFVGAQYELDVYGMLGSSGTRLAAPVFTPGAGSYSAPQAVTISAAAGATIHYTLDGSPPTLASPTYVNPIPVTTAATVRAIAVKGGALTSPAASASYTIAPPPPQIAFVQGNYATPQTAQAGVSVRYTALQSAGDLNVVIVGWGDTTATVQSVTDTSGNTYVRAVGPTLMTGTLSQSIYYAKNILAPGANTVSVSFSAPAVYPDIRILEYRGLDPANPLDVVAAAVGSNATPNSGAATTTAANELIVGADLTTGATVAAGSGFTSRMITVPDADIAEDQVVASTGSYAATASAPGGPWLMQMATFKAAGAGAPATPSAPGTLTASAAGVTAVNLSWGAATETGGTIAQYLIERCQGAGCSNFAQIGTASAPTTSFADSGLTGSSSYSYRVRAKDASGNTGPYSNSATAVTAAATPGAPAALAASAAGSAQINLTWSAATETGGTIAQYLIERCQGSGCSSFTQVGTATTLAFSDTGLSAATAYSYRVRAKDTVGTTGPYSNVASASTAAAAPTISAPGALTASATSATQVTLSWGAATETGGTLSQYLIERCQGAGCSSFTQVATVSVPGTTFADTGLSGSTSYSYRVRAKDTAGNTGPYSNVASATTGTVAPTISAPGTLSAGATSATQIGLSWGAATETGGTLSQYLIERCQGAGCSSFTQVGTTAVPATTFTDSGLTAGTSYSYRVRAQDTAGNTGPYSNTATSVTVTGTPSAPSGLAASAASSTQVNLSWSAATETGGSIAQYLIERCQGAGCSSFTQVGTATQLSFSDSALSGSTAYSYRVRAKDAAGNTGPYSNVATATTAAPTLTAPTALSASSVSSTQINLTWGAASETGGVISQYRVERCQGSGCSTFAQIGTATGTSYNDAGLTASTAYSYRVRAADAGGNTGPYSNLASATTASAGGGGGGPITFVQTSNATPQTPQSTVTVRFNATQVAGDLNVVVVGWGDTTAAVGTVTDSVGNVYRLAVGPTAISGTATQAIYYAANIVGAAAGANSVTVSFTAAAIYPDIRLAEYSGIDPNNPLDVVASATGNSAASTTPPVTTTFANDLLIGANLVQSLTITGGSGFSTRVITSPDGDILEDRIVTATGSYSASANIAAAPWIMQLAAFRRHP
jgi:chitodextrinase